MAQCAEEPRGLYVRGLGSKCTEEALAQVFAAVCKVASITIPVDRPTGFTKGYAFIKLCQGYDADKVRGAVNGIVLDGRKLHVSLLDSRRAATCSRRDGCIAVNTALQRCSAANAILSVCTTSLSSMNQVNLSTALQRLGHAGDVDVDDLRFLKLTRACVNSVSQGKWEPRNLVSAAWALTRLCAFEKLPDLHHAVAEAMILQMAQFKPSHLALAVWSFSTSKIHRPDLFHAVADAALPVVVDFNAQDVANTLRAFAASQIHTPALFKALARRALTVASEFTAQHCENAVWAYATAGFEAVLLFEAVAPCALRQLAFFKPKELATTAWAYATAQVMHAKLFAAIAASATLRVRELNGQDIATLAWAFAKARIDSPRLFQALALSFVDLCKTRPLKPQDVSTCVWAFATAGMMHRGLFLCVARLSPPRMGEFNAQDLSNCAWAFAHAGIDDEVVDGGLGQTEERPDEFGIRRLFDSIAEAASFKACELSTQNLSNLAWSFATANIPAPRLFKAIEAETLGRLADCEPQSLARARAGTFGKRGASTVSDVANTAWAFATAGFAAPELFRGVALAVGKSVETFKPLELTNVAWAFATAGVEEVALFGAIAANASPRIDRNELGALELANLAWAFSAASFAAPALFRAVARSFLKTWPSFSTASSNECVPFRPASRKVPPRVRARRLLDELSPRNLGKLAWSFAHLGVVTECEMHDVYEAISIRACGQLDQMDPQALANISFAFATVGFQPATLASAIAFHKVPQIIDAFNLEQLSQLYQVALFLRLEGGGGGAADAQDAASRLPDFWSFEPRLRRAFESQAPNPSRSQRDVAKCLNRIGFNHDFEHVTRQGLCLDMAQPESWLAVEFDGPWHYVVDVETDDFKVLNGRSVFRRRCLAVLGWAVVHVPYFDWDALGGTEDARDEYLKGLIAEKFSGDAAGLYRPRSASTSKSTTSSFSSASSHRDRGNSFARDRGPSFSAREPFSARERGPSFSAPTAAPKVAPKAAAQRPSFDAAPTNGAAGSKTQLFDEAPSNAATGSRTQSFDGASNGTAPRSNGTVPSDGAAGSRTESFDGTAAPSNGAAGPRTMSLDGTAGLATSRRRPPTAHKPLGQRPPPVPAKRAAAVNPFQALDDDDDEDTGAADADEAVSTSSTQDGKAQDGKAQDGKAPAKKSRRRAVKSKPPAASRQSGPPPGSGAQPRDKGAVADAALLCTGLDLTAPDRPCDDDDDGLESVATVD